jgi:hypothetical protein
VARHGVHTRAATRLAVGLALIAGFPGGIRADVDPARPGVAGSARDVPAVTLRVTPPGPILADGTGRGGLELLEVFVTDSSGRPLDEPPVGSGGRGQFRDALPVAPGHWALPYQPPLVLSDTTETVVVTAGGASAKVELALVVRRLTFPIGVKAGMAVAGGRVGPALGLEVGVWTFLGPAQVGLVLEGGWWMLSGSTTVSIGGVDTAYRGTQGYVPFLLSVGVRVPFADSWFAWLTAGAGGAVVSSRVTLAGQSTAQESGFAPAATGSLSAGPRLGPGFPFLEARLTWIGDAGLSTVSGSGVQFLGLVGYRLDVG